MGQDHPSKKIDTSQHSVFSTTSAVMFIFLLATGATSVENHCRMVYTHTHTHTQIEFRADDGQAKNFGIFKNSNVAATLTAFHSTV